MTLTYPIRSSGLTDDTNHIVSAHTNYFNGHIFKEHRKSYFPREGALYAGVTNRQHINDILVTLLSVAKSAIAPQNINHFFYKRFFLLIPKKQ